VLDDVRRGFMVSAPLAAPVLVRKIALALPARRQLRTPVRIVVTALVDCIRTAVQDGAWQSANWIDEQS